METPPHAEIKSRNTPRTRLTPRVRRILHFLACGNTYTIQEILMGLGQPVGPRHRRAYTTVHRTLAALCRSGIVAKTSMPVHFETTYSLTKAGRSLVPGSRPFLRGNTEAHNTTPSDEGEPIPEEVVVSCPLCGPAWRVPGKSAARALRALDGGEIVTCACGKDLTGAVLLALEQYLEGP